MSEKKTHHLKILVIRFSSIGDIVITSPVIRCLKKQLHAEIHFVTKLQFKSILAFNESISRHFYLEDSFDALLQSLKKQEYDLIIDLHNNTRSRLLSLRLGVQAIRFNKLNLQKLLFAKAKIDLLPEKHLVDRYFEALKSIDVVNDFEGLDFYLDPSPNRFNHLREELLQFQEKICLAIGGTYATKKIPISKWVELIEKTNKQCYIIGGPGDELDANQLADQCNQPIINFCGRLSLQESAYLVSEADVVITGDTGMMHIAAAFKKPVISMWGNTVPKFGMYPYYGDHEIFHFISEVNNLSCRPCSKLGSASCPKGHFKCMIDQDVDMIVKKIDFVLNLK